MGIRTVVTRLVVVLAASGITIASQPWHIPFAPLAVVPPFVRAAPASAPPGQSVELFPEYLIVPGRGIGAFRLGIGVEYLQGRLGAEKGVQTFDDGTKIYRWFEPPTNAGIAARTSDTGTVMRIWILNDPRYSTREGLHVGSTEADVRAMFGAPSEVQDDQQQKTRTLRYSGLGLWVIVQRDNQYTFYNAVYDIGVMPRQ